MGRVSIAQGSGWRARHCVWRHRAKVGGSDQEDHACGFGSNVSVPVRVGFKAGGESHAHAIQSFTNMDSRATVLNDGISAFDLMSRASTSLGQHGALQEVQDSFRPDECLFA